MSVSALPLTNKINVTAGAHILYVYSSEEQYVENATSFIIQAKNLNQKVVFIDSTKRFLLVEEKLRATFPNIDINDYLHYIDNYDFYRMYGDFHFSRVLDNLKDVVKPYVEGKIEIRVWGHVDWRKQENIEQNLCPYECETDITVSEIGYITVCCYDGSSVASKIQIELMKSHEYFMTDDQLVRSSLYKNKEEVVVFPSMKLQHEVETEIDLYKRKLDFIHVVSHEVRNPLTVIKSFATILRSEIEDASHREKLQLIEDYSVAIDHEINHIIQTEQMLTTDVLWKKKLIKPLPALLEVSEIMQLKGRTQNIEVIEEIHMDESLIIHGNVMGFKLIVSNLLSNAIKYSLEGESVFLKVFQLNDNLIIDIIDHGVGMSKEQIDNLFKKYGKLNADKPGQGIGLFMVHKLVELFSGSIEIDSTPQTGTNVRVLFPI